MKSHGYGVRISLSTGALVGRPMALRDDIARCGPFGIACVDVIPPLDSWTRKTIEREPAYRVVDLRTHARSGNLAPRSGRFALGRNHLHDVATAIGTPALAFAYVDRHRGYGTRTVYVRKVADPKPILVCRERFRLQLSNGARAGVAGHLECETSVSL